MADDLWRAIQSHRWKHASFMGKIRNRKRRRLRQLKHDVDEMEDENIQSHLPSNRDIEQHLIESLLSPFLDLPISGYNLIEKELIANSSVDDIPNTLQKLAAQSLIILQPDGHSISSVDLDKLSRVAEVSGLTGKVEGLPRFQTDKDEVTWLLNAPSVRDKENRRVGVEIQELLNTKSVKEQLMVERFQSAGGSQLREFCPQKTRENCRRSSGSGRACPRLHFRKIIQSHTDESLGDCSFLNTCFHMESCKFVHYEIDETLETEPHQRTSKRPHPSLQVTGTKLVPPQWINCDLRNFDMSILGKFTVVMADPPWDIHMELPYGTMSDDEMRQHAIPTLQDNGYIFLWVTGRAMELGRECLTLWGYERIDEIIWVKTNQLQRLIRTGRTGHWINHGKEHCLIGVKGEPKGINHGIDCDVIVAEVRATSRKPDEIYGVIERLSPGSRKIELFGRQHNCQPNWLTLGNQLDGVHIHDPELRKRFYAKYPSGLAFPTSSQPTIG